MEIELQHMLQFLCDVFSPHERQAGEQGAEHDRQDDDRGPASDVAQLAHGGVVLAVRVHENTTIRSPMASGQPAKSTLK